MVNKETFHTVISYLTGSEKDQLIAKLKSQNIPYVVNNHGASARDKSFYFELRVPQSDIPKAKKIVNSFKAIRSINKNNCPKCNYRLYKIVEKPTFFERIYYMGTTLVQCKRCKTKYAI